MAIANKSGVNYVTPPNVTGSGSVNRGGVATRVGSSSKLVRNVVVSKDTTGVFGSKVVDGMDTDPSVSGGVFAYNNLKPITFKVTTKIAGLNSTSLRTSSNNPAQLRSINKRESFKSDGKATAFRAGYFNLYTGRYSPAPTPVTENPGTDTAATVSRTSPGDLVYRTGAKLPVRNNDYKAKTG